MITPEVDLRSLYLRTTYYLEAEGRRVGLRVGTYNQELDQLMHALGAASWAYLTAANPGSRSLSDADNTTRHEALASELLASGYKVYPGFGIPDAGDWPPEHSLLVVGLAQDSALILGRKYGQVAIVVGDVGSEPRLLFCGT